MALIRYISVSLFVLGTLYSTGASASILETLKQKRKDYLNIRKSHFSLLPHRQMYLIPYSYNWMPNEDIYAFRDKGENKGDTYRNAEAEFQISFATPFAKGLYGKDWDIMAAYTQQSFWQVYNAGWSRPFRETNYMPEIFSRYIYKHPKELGPIKLHLLDTGYIHQSNGQVNELSRSWDRLYVKGLFEAYGFYAQVTLWHRMREKRSEDDNPDILKYMGHGEIELIKSFEKHTFHVKLPLLSKYFGHDIKYSYPVSTNVRWFINYRSGYGQSMIEFDRQTQRLGAGFMFDHFLY